MSALGKSTRKIVESDALSNSKAIEETRIDCSPVNSPDNAKEFVRIAFATPVPALKSFFPDASASAASSSTTTLHITLVVGSGKKEGRSKFDEALPKWITMSLREFSYKDDRDIVGEPGTFKYMHDTGKNEKVIVVHPLITPLPEKENEGEEGEEGEGDVVDETPEWMCLSVESEETFNKMVQAKVPTWTLKKRLVGIIEGAIGKFQTAEEKLVKLEDLTPDEKKVYDNLDVDNLKKKIAMLHKMMAEHVETGTITGAEKTQLIANIQTKLNGAEGSDPEKKNQLLTRKTKLESTPLVPGANSSLKRENELAKLWRRLDKIKLLEEKAGVKSINSGKLTPAEVDEILAKPEVEGIIEDITIENRFWFETDEEWKARIEDNRRRLMNIKPAKPVKPTAGAGAGSSASASKPPNDGFTKAGGGKKTYASVSSSGGSSKGGSNNKFSSLF